MHRAIHNLTLQSNATPVIHAKAGSLCSVVAKVIQPANFEDRLIMIFLSSLDLELMKNARSPKIWAP